MAIITFKSSDNLFVRVAKLVGIINEKQDKLPYKVYTALLTQSGTDAPVATVLEDTLGDTITYTYETTGVWLAVNNSGNFPFDKTSIRVHSNQPGVILLAGTDEDPNGSNIKINKYGVSAGNLVVQDRLVNATLEIRVYN